MSTTVKATIAQQQIPETKEWHSVKQGANSGGSYTYLGERNTDSYEFVQGVGFTKDDNIVMCTTDSATYVVAKNQDGKWFTVAKMVAHGYIVHG